MATGDGSLAERRIAARSLILTSALVVLMTGCYFPTQGIRDPNPGPTATPPWPYQEGTYPPGRSTPAVANPSAAPVSAGVPPPRPSAGYPSAGYPGAGHAGAGYPGAGHPQDYAHTPPPPSQSVVPQYSDWLFDGPEGRGFAYYLAEGYRRYAKHEDNAHDFEDAAKFIFRAAAVDRGEHVEPEQMNMRTLPAYAVDDLLYARQRLMRALNRGAAQRLPRIAANAQVAFDCWMEQQEENLQPHDVARCRRDFEGFIVRLEGPPKREVAPCPPEPCPASAPCPAPVCDTTPLLVHFALDKHDISPAARAVVQRAAEMARQTANRALVVTAHADRAGSDKHNDALSKRRLDAVLEALASAGVPRERLARAQHFGETRPRVATADGVREPENRRVEIRLWCEPMAPDTPRCAQSPAAEPGCTGTPRRCGVAQSVDR